MVFPNRFAKKQGLFRSCSSWSNWLSGNDEYHCRRDIYMYLSCERLGLKQEEDRFAGQRD